MFTLFVAKLIIKMFDTFLFLPPAAIFFGILVIMTKRLKTKLEVFEFKTNFKVTV